ncbi:hypothetical protein DXG01_007216 [Tephrocybe rancida]|nr:hypothetical protein DXG01_007216 [Tephrocybe rancida]
MVRSTVIVRASDALPLAASVDDEQTEQSLQEHKQQSKLIFRRITPNSEPRCSIESGQYTLHYLISDNVVFLTIADKSYPRKLAFSYLDELSKEFATTYGPKVETVRKPYAFVGFDTFMSKTARLYRDTRTATATSGLDRLNDDLQDVTRIMTKNMEELLWRGDSLDRMSHLSTSLRSESEKYRKAARNINFNAMLRCEGTKKQHKPSPHSYIQECIEQPPRMADLLHHINNHLPTVNPTGSAHTLLHLLLQNQLPREILCILAPPTVGRINCTMIDADLASEQSLLDGSVVNGIQWVPGEVTQHIPPGAQSGKDSAEFQMAWRRDDMGDNQWGRDDDRRRQSEAEAKRNRELDNDLRKARGLDAQARERRNSFNASPQPTQAGAYAFPTSGSGPQYPRGSYAGYSDRPAGSTGAPGYPSSAYSDIDRQMGDLDLRDRAGGYPGEERKVSTHAPRPRKYSANEPVDVPRAISPHPGARAGDGRGATGPYGAAIATGAYNTGRPYSAAGQHRSASPNPAPFVPPAPSSYSQYQSSNVRAPEPVSRSTTPFGGPSGGPPAVYPRGHIMEGQPILPQDRARMSPMPPRGPSRGPSPGPPGPYSSSSVGPPHAGSSPNMHGPPFPGGPGSRQLAAPEGFSRPVNGSHPFTPFEIMKIQDMDKFWSQIPRMPNVLVTHDVLEPDWSRLMTDVALAWAGKLPIPEMEQGVPTKRSSVIADLVDLWNESFFFVRGAELVLYRGKERRTGPRSGTVERDLPYLDEPDDYISSEEEVSEDNSNSDLDYGAGRYQHAYGDPHQQLAEVFEDGRRRKEMKLAREAERRKRRQERHRKRRERFRARKYALYLTYYPTQIGGGYGGNGGYPSGSSYGGRY